MRCRSSYSPSPSWGYGRRCRSPSPRDRCYGGRGRDLPTSLLVRNLRLDCRAEDLRGPFGQFGQLKDIYFSRDYHTGEPRGFGFVQYVDPADAADAKYHMDGDACFQLMALRLRACRIRSVYDQRRSLLRYSRSPRYARTHSRSPDYYSPSPRWRHYSRSISLETECIGSGHTQDRLMGQGAKAGAGALVGHTLGD
ncbi:serine/arginine-rich SC35-like splicing factor SCL33 isoform X1 [Fagus crenata]